MKAIRNAIALATLAVVGTVIVTGVVVELGIAAVRRLG